MNAMPVFHCFMLVKTGLFRTNWSELTNIMIRCICYTKVCERTPMSDLRTHMGISSIEDTIRYNPIHWFGLLQQMDEDKWPEKLLHLVVTLKVTQRKDSLTTFSFC